MLEFQLAGFGLVRSGLNLGTVIGDTMEFRPINVGVDSITVVAEPEADAATVDGLSVSFVAPGWYQLRLASVLGSRDLKVLAVSADALKEIPVSRHDCSTPDAAATKRRTILQGFANCDSSAGCAGDVASMRPVHWQNYGGTGNSQAATNF